MMIAISFSRGGMEVPNRTKAPRRWTRSQRSGLRSSALKGPRRPAPRGPDWIASATRFWSALIVSGVSVVNLDSLIAFLPDGFDLDSRAAPDGFDLDSRAVLKRPWWTLPRAILGVPRTSIAGSPRTERAGRAPLDDRARHVRRQRRAVFDVLHGARMDEP